MKKILPVEGHLGRQVAGNRHVKEILARWTIDDVAMEIKKMKA